MFDRAATRPGGSGLAAASRRRLVRTCSRPSAAMQPPSTARSARRLSASLARRPVCLAGQPRAGADREIRGRTPDGPRLSVPVRPACDAAWQARRPARMIVDDDDSAIRTCRYQIGRVRFAKPRLRSTHPSASHITGKLSSPRNAQPPIRTGSLSSSRKPFSRAKMPGSATSATIAREAKAPAQ